MTERERLTTNERKIFARESFTLNSMNKGELRKHYNEIFDRLQKYEIAEEAGKLVQLPKGITLDEITAIMQQRTRSGKNKGGLDEYTLDYASQFLHDAGFTEASKALDCEFDL